MSDFIDPALGIPVALILFGVYIFIRLTEDRRQAATLAQIQRTTAFIAASELWGTNPNNWPAEVRDTLEVEL